MILTSTLTRWVGVVILGATAAILVLKSVLILVPAHSSRCRGLEASAVSRREVGGYQG
jgi:hypothetical protein